MKELVSRIHDCRICEPYLAMGVNPVFAAVPDSRIAIIGQAPGRKVHESGIPWDDKSGQNLRAWLGVTEEEFYNPHLFAIIPMGFCYPGKGSSGDLPPRKECAPKWHSALFEQLKEIRFTLLVGQYAQRYYLESRAERNLTETVKNFSTYLPEFYPLPHPSPRNNIWMKKNPWFKDGLLPDLRERVREVLGE